MKIYLLKAERCDKFYDFAVFGHVATWSKNYESCETCGFLNQHLVEPLLVEWEPDSDIIGDFSWCSYSIVVLERVKRFFEDRNFEARYGKVEVIKPSKIYKRKKKQVPFPYAGPKLHWLMPTERVNLDIEKSRLEIKTNCADCGRLVYKFKMEGLVIPESEWKKRKMFRISQWRSSATFVSEEALTEILSQNFTNFWYKEAGYARAGRNAVPFPPGVRTKPGTGK